MIPLTLSHTRTSIMNLAVLALLHPAYAHSAAYSSPLMRSEVNYSSYHWSCNLKCVKWHTHVQFLWNLNSAHALIDMSVYARDCKNCESPCTWLHAFRMLAHCEGRSRIKVVAILEPPSHVKVGPPILQHFCWVCPSITCSSYTTLACLHLYCNPIVA